MNFSEKLNKQRKINNISQEQLADALGISRQSVSKWENGESYPDMAKIVQICKVLNCSLNDIVDDEVIGDMPDNETVATNKKNYLEDFLNYVTKTYNMFIHMSLKSKLAMITEMLFLGLFLLIVGTIIILGVDGLLNFALHFLSYQIRRSIIDILVSLLAIVIALVAILVFFHLFKIRYLDYYVTIEDNNVTEQTVEEPIEENQDNSELVKKKNSVIVIRDPKHSSSRFFNGLAKCIGIVLKGILVLMALPFVGMFIGAVALSFYALFMSGSVFRNFALSAIGAGALCYLVIHFVYNVVFDLKQPFKAFLIVMMSALVTVGAGIGLGFKAISDLKIVEGDYMKETIELPDFDENSTLYLNSNDLSINVDDSVEGIILEIEHPENSTLGMNRDIRMEDESDIYTYYVYSYVDDIPMIKTILDDLNQGVIKSRYGDSYMRSVVITCNSELSENIMSRINY